MRPKAIATFEWLFIASVILSLINIFVIAPGEGRLIEAAVAVLTIGLALVVSRMRSNVVRWILTVLTLLGVAGQGYLLATAGLAGAGGVVGLAVSALQIAAIAQLFRPEANGWFGRRDLAAG